MYFKIFIRRFSSTKPHSHTSPFIYLAHIMTGTCGERERERDPFPSLSFILSLFVPHARKKKDRESSPTDFVRNHNEKGTPLLVEMKKSVD